MLNFDVFRAALLPIFFFTPGIFGGFLKSLFLGDFFFPSPYCYPASVQKIFFRLGGIFEFGKAKQPVYVFIFVGFSFRIAVELGIILVFCILISSIPYLCSCINVG